MAIQVDKEKWILYKHTNSYEMIKAVAMDVKNQCGTDISETERHRMQQRLANLDLYHARNPKLKLDSMNHRINTLEFFLFGYETTLLGVKRFIFSPLGNLFLKYIDDDDKTRKIFATMLIAIQFEHYANGTPASIQLYPFRLIFTLLLDARLEYKLYYAEYAYCIADLHEITEDSYERLVSKILEFRKKPREEIVEMMKTDEHYYVNCVYEWQYYITSILEQAGIFHRIEGDEMCRLFHPTKPNSKSKPTGRKLNDGFVEIATDSWLYTENDEGVQLLSASSKVGRRDTYEDGYRKGDLFFLPNDSYRRNWRGRRLADQTPAITKDDRRICQQRGG